MNAGLQVRKEELSRDFNCGYWQKRFTLRPEQTPAFLEEHAQALEAAAELDEEELGQRGANPSVGDTQPYLGQVRPRCLEASTNDVLFDDE